MAEIWIWNSMARRRRSASDTFEENGIQIIKSFLHTHDHRVEVFDWATDSGYNSLSPPLLPSLIRITFSKIISNPDSILIKKVLGPVFLFMQSTLSAIQWLRMASKLKKLARNSKSHGVKLFGIKVWYGEAFYWSKYLVSRINRYNPDCITIAGGYHASLYEEDLLKYSNFDLAIAHEGEHGLLNILNEIEGLQTSKPNWNKNEVLKSLRDKARNQLFPNLIYRNNGKIAKTGRAIEKLQIDSKKAVPNYRINSGKTKVHILLGSLGCPWNKCHFCVHNQFNPVYKTRDIDELIVEIKAMLKQNIGLFRLTGSDTPYDSGREIAERILDEKMQIEFAMGSRAVNNSKDPQVAKKVTDAYCTMIKAGLRALFIGGECGNDLINQKMMNKGINRSDLIHTIKAIRKAQEKTGIHVDISLALIHPTPLLEGIDELQVRNDNLSLLRETQPDSAVISPPGPFKNSNWYNQSDLFGFELSGDFIEKFIEYEYVLYKPLDLWPELDIKLNGIPFKEQLKRSQQFQNQVENELGILCNLCDEHFMMSRAAGLNSKEELNYFKRKSLESIVSADYRFLDDISQKVNEYSRSLAQKNQNAL